MSYPNMSGLDLFGGLRNFVMSPFSGDDSELGSSDIADIQDQYNDQRDRTRQRAGDLGFDGDYRPAVVTKTDPFEGTVAELRAKVDKIDITAVSDLISAWNEISTRNSTSLDEFRKQIARGMSPDVWSGAAATAAAQTVAAYDITGKKVTTAAALTSNKLDELRTGLEPTKRLVPFAPEHRSGVDNALGLFQGRAWRNDDVAQENARVEAVRVLQTVYAPVIHESDEKVPVIPIPKTVDPGGTPEIPGGSPNPGTGNPNSSNPNSGQPSTPTTPAASTPSTDPGDTTDDPSTDDPSTDDPTTQDSTTPDSTTPQSTVPAGTTPASTPTTPGSGLPSGSPSGAGTPGGGSPGGGTPGAGTPGGAVPGSPNAGTTGAATRAGAAGSGAAGRSGMPGGMSPGARGGGQDDESSKAIPDYLITQEHGDELTGLDNLPKMVPPVIGGD
ncbi:hypothetical protein ACFC06_16320 [Nocardia sp. NPDC056064]|uniref:hypothetical protein n=1 Tax=Nocardia sp. NPDC056064 TaxID=3345701 RepID=UPI0035D62CCB